MASIYLHWHKALITGLILLFASVAGLRGQIIPLESPEIVRVSVDTASGLALIQWEASTSPDIEKYELYFDSTILGQAVWKLAGTVDGDTRQYYYTRIDPGTESWSLSVLAYDSLGNKSNFTQSHSTVHLSCAYDSCSKSMELTWTSYLGWEDLARYEVYYSVDGGAYRFLEATGKEDTSYVHPTITENRFYCYFIRAVSASTDSYSNMVCRYVSHPLHPAWVNAESASAVRETGIEVKFAMDPASEVSSYQLFRAAGPGKPFIAGEIFRDVGDTLSHRDEVLSTDRQYQYRLYSLDVCDNPVIASNVCGNIVLNTSSSGLLAFLNWSPYSEYEAGVGNYHIYRSINQSDFVLLDDGVHATDTSYEDDLSFVSEEQIEDEIRYLVLAVENGSWSLGEQGFSWSNEASVFVVPEIRMANAFTPDGNLINDEIKPVLSFIPRLYVFAVFDRWGNKIFETSDHEVGWDGRIKGGKKATEGVYVYYIKLTTSNGIEVEKRGEITVFYP